MGNARPFRGKNLRGACDFPLCKRHEALIHQHIGNSRICGRGLDCNASVLDSPAGQTGGKEPVLTAVGRYVDWNPSFSWDLVARKWAEMSRTYQTWSQGWCNLTGRDQMRFHKAQRWSKGVWKQWLMEEFRTRMLLDLLMPGVFFVLLMTCVSVHWIFPSLPLCFVIELPWDLY